MARDVALAHREETGVRAPRQHPEPLPLYPECPRWSGPDDYTAALEETVEATERRRAAWPCSRLLDPLGPRTHTIGR